MMTNQRPASATTITLAVSTAMATLLLVATIGMAAWLWADGEALRATTPAGRGLVDLTLAHDVSAATAIVERWRAEGLRVVADRQLRLDDWFIPLYTVALLAWLWWGVEWSQSARWNAVALTLVALGAATCDWYENAALVTALDGHLSGEAMIGLRRFAQLKWAGVMVVGLGMLAYVGAAVRRLNNDRVRAQRAQGAHDAPAAAVVRSRPFDQLIAEESAAIFAARHDVPDDGPFRRVRAAVTSEPWVEFRSGELVGLALSGGGIRSATFNLGVLQQLHADGVLPLVDYVSTVSGGGYVGGFWSAWLHDQRHRRPPRVLTPDVRPAPFAAEPREVRHIREFARFLAPRAGLFDVEAWRAVAAVVSGIVPALLIAGGVVTLVLVAWITLTFTYASQWMLLGVRPAPAIFVTLVASGLHVLLEGWWRRGEPHSGRRSVPLRSYSLWAGVASAAAGAAQMILHTRHATWFEHEYAVGCAALSGPVHWQALGTATAYDGWWTLLGIRTVCASGRAFISPHLFDFAAAWLSVALALVFVRLVPEGIGNPWPRQVVSAFDRIVMRFLAMASVWTFLALLWHLCVNVGWTFKMLVPVAVSAAAFAASRNWLPHAGRTQPQGWLSRLLVVGPQALAYGTVFLAVGGVGAGLIRVNGSDWFSWWVSTAATGTVLVFALFIEPDRFGLHGFYRDRLARAFLGARRTDLPGGNRGTEFEDQDDLLLNRLETRPLHLVCCAVNDLSGDRVETLSRGARSATLSRHGLAVAGCWAPRPAVTLASALTASAAAFNSNMGSVSTRLGPVVSFLMSALNLRLGLWDRHPAAAVAEFRRWPGVLLFREMFGLTSAKSQTAHGTDSELSVWDRDVHLSDGGHFDNLGLYELVRRHCRYVIVSDCGADPSVAFDDLGNAIRRIREDFGVDIQIDIDPLRPAGESGYSEQHVAIGSIKYSHIDRGILIYLKPALTGDEPQDVRQYRTHNGAFPHESTVDQFYDEAQWESYRRLGQHSAERAFAFAHEQGLTGRLTGESLFGHARYAWFPTPKGLREDVLAMTARFAQVEHELRASGTGRLVREAFPELEWARPSTGAAAPRPDTPAEHGPELVDMAGQDLAFMLRLTQAMEDAWNACRLEHHWDHPLNVGWVNLFARWTGTATFRSWWPLIAPMYGLGFTRFLSQRLGMRHARRVVGHGSGRGLPPHRTPPAGLAHTLWERSGSPLPWRRTGAPDGVETRYFQLNIAPAEAAAGAESYQVGLTALRARRDDDARAWVAGWTSADFFVPPSLWGAGYGGMMLDGLLAALVGTCDTCYVSVLAPAADDDHRVARIDERSFIEQYRRFQFQQLPSDDPQREVITHLGLALGPRDTVLVRRMSVEQPPGSLSGPLWPAV